jgi:hypothetical protein
MLMRALLVTVAVVGLSTAAYSQTDCEPARCAVQAALDAECPCSVAGNHGRHVSCVAHVVKRLAADGTIPRNCKGKITRCAARSICGKEGFVTCQIPVLGTCDTVAGTCVENAALLCTTDAECVIGSKCKIKRSAEQCASRGGTVGDSPTCCSSCVTPVP